MRLQQRIVHLDLKGGAYKPAYYPHLFDTLARMNFTGVMIEWEEMFPYTGQLAPALNDYVYTLDEIRGILRAAAERKLEVIPLVQTFGHLEWFLKLAPFAHMREDARYPQVICFGANASFELLRDMIDQVARVHREFGMRRFHMGADEAFQIGSCRETQQLIRAQGSNERAILAHLSRVARYIQQTYGVTVLAWHDMFANMMQEDILAFDLPNLLQPVLWSYAEDLEMYLPYTTWLALKPFSHVWGASVFKGADGPQQWVSNPIHYLRNHESWVTQFSRASREIEHLEGLIYCGWSRYDHLATLCELMPIALPQLAMCTETMMAARPLEANYPKTREWLGCDAPTSKMGYTTGCNFAGAKLYELINEYANRREQARNFAETDYDFNGWLSRAAVGYSSTSPMYIDKILPNIDYHLQPLERIVAEFRVAAAEIYFPETIEEYILVYLSDIVELLRSRRDRAVEMREQRTFPKRPFVKAAQKADL